ncbi:AraC family transcriptional regulator [Escherichia coli]|nr:AraC family transcriptional regulator [Escherichia coli]
MNCSFIFVRKSFAFRLFNDVAMLNYGDILLASPTARTKLLIHSNCFTEIQFSHETIDWYIKNSPVVNKNNTSKKNIYFIKKCFAYPKLLIDLVENIDCDDHIHPEFRKAIFLSLLSIFNRESGLMSLLFSGMPAFSGKVRKTLLSEPSRQWTLRDISEYMYMSERLIKKKLFLEKTSFSKIRLEARMLFAKVLLEQNHPMEYIAEKCGYSSASYFVYVFKKYYNITPQQLLHNE